MKRKADYTRLLYERHVTVGGPLLLALCCWWIWWRDATSRRIGIYVSMVLFEFYTIHEPDTHFDDEADGTKLKILLDAFVNG